MKKLYILRHGKALSASQAGVASDFERPLAPEGRQDVRRTVRHLTAQGARPSLILHSPLRRALQSADEARDLARPSGGIEALESLSNELSPEELYPQLQERAASVDELLIVGHQPQLGELTAFLNGRSHLLMPGGIIALDVGSPSKAELLWTCNPEDLPD